MTYSISNLKDHINASITLRVLVHMAQGTAVNNTALGNRVYIDKLNQVEDALGVERDSYIKANIEIARESQEHYKQRPLAPIENKIAPISNNYTGAHAIQFIDSEGTSMFDIINRIKIEAAIPAPREHSAETYGKPRTPQVRFAEQEQQRREENPYAAAFRF